MPSLGKLPYSGDRKERIDRLNELDASTSIWMDRGKGTKTEKLNRRQREREWNIPGVFSPRREIGSSAFFKQRESNQQQKRKTKQMLQKILDWMLYNPLIWSTTVQQRDQRMKCWHAASLLSPLSSSGSHGDHKIQTKSHVSGGNISCHG